MTTVTGLDEPLGVRQIRRIAVAGGAGSGKSTLARTLCERLGVPYVSLESFYLGPGGSTTPVRW
jgi:adenylate kinase family enzyme